MRVPRTLREAIQVSIEKAIDEGRSVQEIAEECGVSDSTIYRWNKDEDSTSYADLPTRRLWQFMRSTNSLAVLDYLERKFNRISFSMPKVAITRQEESEVIESYQEITIDAVKSLRKFFSNPNKKNYEIVEDALREMISKSASVKKLCDKKITGQFEIDFKTK